MSKRLGFLLSLGLVLAGGGLLLFSAWRTLTFVVDGQPRTARVLAFTVRGALRAADIPLGAEDRVRPPQTALLPANGQITVEHTRRVDLWYEGQPGLAPLWSAERLPANLLAQVGIRLFPGDRFWLNGQLFVPNMPLPPGEHTLLQVRRAAPLTLIENGAARTFSSSAATLGRALWDAGVRLGPGDALSPPPETALREALTVTLRRAQPLTIRLPEGKRHTRSAAQTVGAALAEAGVPLQNLDYSRPAEDQPLPADGQIRVVRVSEEIQLEQTPIAFKKEFVQDPDLELDQQRELQAGQYGVRVARVRIRYENDEEVNRQKEAEWEAVPARAQKIGYGTRVVLHTLQTPSGPLQYWRAVKVYATSYSPCRLGVPGKCSTRSASGRTLQRGIIGTSGAWYRLLNGQQVYVPNYGVGVIADYGAVPSAWIDLGYSDDDFVPWHQNTTLYFLAPAPENIPWILP